MTIHYPETLNLENTIFELAYIRINDDHVYVSGSAEVSVQEYDGNFIGITNWRDDAEDDGIRHFTQYGDLYDGFVWRR